MSICVVCLVFTVSTLQPIACDNSIENRKNNNNGDNDDDDDDGTKERNPVPVDATRAPLTKVCATVQRQPNFFDVIEKVFR